MPTLHEVESHDDISRLEGEGGIAAFPNERKIDPHEAAVEVLRAVSNLKASRAAVEPPRGPRDLGVYVTRSDPAAHAARLAAYT